MTKLEELAEKVTSYRKMYDVAVNNYRVAHQEETRCLNLKNQAEKDLQKAVEELRKVALEGTPTDLYGSTGSVVRDR